jgi:molybdopterin molybdotransferase
VKAFTKLVTPQQARDILAGTYRPAPLRIERVPLPQALHRVLAQDVSASTDLPAFDRSTVDGYAVQAVNTASASGGTAVTLYLAGEVFMGDEVRFAVGKGQAARIPTGGMLPAGADAVVMQEHTTRHDGIVAVQRSVKVGDNVVPRGADVRAGEVILRPGRRLRAQDLGLLAGLGMAEVAVFLRPRVGIIVTGDELVPPGRPLRGSQIYDMNTYTLAGLVEEAGGAAAPYGIATDNMTVLMERATLAHRECDVLILAGGSSVGEKDIVADAIAALGAPGILVHGIAIRPGRPTILAVAGGKPVFGLPGNVVSAMVIFDQFVRPVVQALAGFTESPRPGGTVRARLTTKVTTGDREDHLRVSFVARTGALWAVPLPSGSAIITSMVRADGIVVVPEQTTWEEGAEVEVRLLP